MSALAARSTSPRSMANVQRRPSKYSASRSPQRCAARSIRSPKVSFSNHMTLAFSVERSAVWEPASLEMGSYAKRSTLKAERSFQLADEPFQAFEGERDVRFHE